MTKTVSLMATSDEISSEVATAILTKQEQLGRDPQELLEIVLRVHSTLRELSLRSGRNRYERLSRYTSARG
jgi:hypothetical protein